jgi:hypothetical protein
MAVQEVELVDVLQVSQLFEGFGCPSAKHEPATRQNPDWTFCTQPAASSHVAVLQAVLLQGWVVPPSVHCPDLQVFGVV